MALVSGINNLTVEKPNDGGKLSGETVDLDRQDWRQLGADQIVNYVGSNAYLVAIVLMCNGGGYRDQTAADPTSINNTLSAQSYRFESLCL